MFTIDIHLDLSMNAMEWNRDLRLPVTDINEREKGKKDLPGRENALVSFPELRKGNLGLVVATQIARYVAPGNPLPGWHSPEQAWAQTQSQLAWYRAMEDAGEMVQIKNLTDLNQVTEGVPASLRSPTANPATHNPQPTSHNPQPATHNPQPATHNPQPAPLAYILSLEGADSLVDLSYLDKAVSYGLKAIGPAHYGPGRYANGTDSSGKMGQMGIELLKAMDSHRLILDMTHLCDDAFWQAIDLYQGPVWASHQNCRALVPHNRQFDDAQFKVLIERDAVVGAAMDAWMIVPGWKRGESTPRQKTCNLNAVIDHIDHICQLAGNARHVCIGSDLDGGFGREQAPYDLETIADLQNLPSLLQKRGYSEADINGLMHGNVLRFLQDAWR